MAKDESLYGVIEPTGSMMMPILRDVDAIGVRNSVDCDEAANYTAISPVNARISANLQFAMGVVATLMSIWYKSVFCLGITGGKQRAQVIEWPQDTCRGRQ
jgi:hypothetical protein